MSDAPSGIFIKALPVFLFDIVLLNSEIYPYPAVLVKINLSSGSPISADIKLTPDSAFTRPDIGSPIPLAEGSE